MRKYSPPLPPLLGQGFIRIPLCLLTLMGSLELFLPGPGPGRRASMSSSQDTGNDPDPVLQRPRSGPSPESVPDGQPPRKG